VSPLVRIYNSRLGTSQKSEISRHRADSDQSIEKQMIQFESFEEEKALSRNETAAAV
jgi:hypothetical protein